MATERIPVGTSHAHGRTWPLYERDAFSVEVVGQVDANDIKSAESLAAELRAVLDRYGVTVRVYPVKVMEMSPEDKAEKEELDAQAVGGHLAASEIASVLENH